MLMKRPTGAASTTAIVTRVASSRSGVGGGKENATNAKQPLPLEQRPEFTVLMKAKVRVPGERVGKEPPHHELKKSLPSRTEVILALRERTAQNLSYEGILNDQLVMQKALLIRTQAASYGHDPLVVMSYVGQRAQEAVEEDVGRIINELTELHGPHPTHRVTAYAELSTDLGKQLESVVFDQHFDKVMQISQEFKLREEELKAKEKTTNQAVEVQKEEINNLVKANIELEQEKKAMERMTEMMKKEVEEALHAQLQAQQKLVEIRMQGLDYKAEVDRRIEKVMVSVESQMGYIPDAVEKQLFYVQLLKPPGDPDYDEARRAGDHRAEKKYRIMKRQPSNGEPAKRWFETVADGSAPCGGGSDDDDDDEDGDDGADAAKAGSRTPRVVAMVKARGPSKGGRGKGGKGKGGRSKGSGADAAAPAVHSDNQQVLAQLMTCIVGKGAGRMVLEEEARRGHKKQPIPSYTRPPRGDSLNRASLTDVYPYGLTHSPPNEGDKLKRELLRQQAAISAGAPAPALSPLLQAILAPHNPSPNARTRAAQSSVTKRLASKKPKGGLGQKRAAMTSAVGLNRTSYPPHPSVGAGDLTSAGAVIDETYERFRSSIDMLRKNIVHGTVASISAGSGAVGSATRGADLVNISAVTQATAFAAAADADRSHGAAAVPVGQGQRKKRRTLAARRSVDNVSYLMTKSAETYATRTVQTLSGVSRDDVDGQEEEEVLAAALRGKQERTPLDWEKWAMLRRSLADDGGDGDDSAALALISASVATEVATRAEALTERTLAGRAAAESALLEAAKAKEAIDSTPSDQSYPREELYSSGGSRPSAGASVYSHSHSHSQSPSHSHAQSQSQSMSGNSSDESERVRAPAGTGTGAGGGSRAASPSSSAASSSFLRERLEPLVEAEDRALEALRRKFAHVDINEGFEDTVGVLHAGAAPGTRGVAQRLPPSPKRASSSSSSGGGGGGRAGRGQSRRRDVVDDSDDDDNVEDVYMGGDGGAGAYVSSTDEEDSLDNAAGDSDTHTSTSMLDSYLKEIGARRR